MRRTPFFLPRRHRIEVIFLEARRSARPRAEVAGLCSCSKVRESAQPGGGPLNKFYAFPDAGASAAPGCEQAGDYRLRASFGHVTTWVFDLDNTLYPPDSGIWTMIDERITLFLIDLFGLDGQSARALHRHYYLQHGSTLRGLVEENIDAAERFLEFVHDIDRSALKPDLKLAREVGQLRGRKLIFTNGSRDHALLTARQLGLDGLFEDAFDIVAANLTPKPAEAAYRAFCDRYDVDPRRAAMFEDVAKNSHGSQSAGDDDGSRDCQTGPCGSSGKPRPGRPARCRGRRLYHGRFGAISGPTECGAGLANSSGQVRTVRLFAAIVPPPGARRQASLDRDLPSPIFTGLRPSRFSAREVVGLQHREAIVLWMTKAGRGGPTGRNPSVDGLPSRVALSAPLSVP